MFKCENCEGVFEECGTVKESRGQFGDSICFEEMAVCPYCHSENIYEAVQCPKCKEWMFDDETDSQFCEACEGEIKEEYEASPQKCFDLCKYADKMEVEINSFLYYVYEPEEIEEILMEHLKGNTRKCKEFIESDEGYFFDLIETKQDTEAYERGER